MFKAMDINLFMFILKKLSNLKEKKNSLQNLFKINYIQSNNSIIIIK